MKAEPAESLEFLKKTARDAPLEPGVYLMRDGESRVIYVGKARILRNRLVSYFSGKKDVKTATLLAHAASIETIIVANEYEALLLENTLIKQHSPKYNINLKDGKTYPVIRFTTGDFPRVFRTRHIIDDGSRYFGPFPNIGALDAMLELIERLFPLRKCRTLKKRESPCMYYHIGRCRAPCCGRISAGDYRIHAERAQKLLSGETESLIIELTGAMHDAARKLRFEQAAHIRDAIKSLEGFSGGNSAVVDFDPEGRDYISWAAEGVFRTYTVFSMRGGKMTGRELFRTRSAADEQDSLETFIAVYYSPDRPPPARIFLPAGEGNEPYSLESGGALAEWFSTNFGYTPELRVPDEKRHLAALAMARQNAQEDLRKRLKERGAGPALDELARALSLKARPERIEGFDIAQLDGTHPVASLISFKNGMPDRKNYRYFKLRSVVGVVDDFAAMREAVRRRYSRLIREGLELPDLVLVDGGIGQVNAARGVLDELGLDCDVAGLAKRDEELWLPHTAEPIRLSRDSEALKTLQFVRDETHRFATSFNQKLRSGDLFFPILESVEGIGPKRAAAIMKAFVSVENIAAAPPLTLAERCKIPLAAAQAVCASAKLALEDQKAARERLKKQDGRRRTPGTPLPVDAGALAAEAASADV
ncbi:MAG: excinuclease ABC subunit UvrC [Treponema sp.]|jgi:excinuclease ABC subunit C|nr:excinuclease ABC subunit UvrC [Treponema sp.]